MNRLSDEIEHSMFGLREGSEGVIEAHFSFPPEFIGFQGHFPGKPILPGVCKIQATLLILKTWKRKKVALKEIVLAKFFSPVTCGQEVVFTCRECKSGGSRETLIKALVESEGKKVAELHLKVVISPEEGGSCIAE
ncbi:MAG: hypothetical protein AB1611_10170 [bacterium]